MSKSTLSITVIQPNFPGATVGLPRAIEVPCRLPESFDFAFSAFGGTIKAVAYLSKWDSPAEAVVGDWEMTSGPDVECADLMTKHSDAILASIKTYLGMGPDVMPTTRGVLSAIALAYEAEVAAYDAALRAHAALPRYLHSLALVPSHPSDDGVTSYAALMLRKYVEHVVEQACKAQTERAEAQAKVTP